MTPMRLTVLAALMLGATSAGAAEFSTGPMIRDYGPVVAVADPRVGPHNTFKVAFDVAQAAKPGAVNRSMESAARFLNMHAAAGVPADNLSVALVVHGPAAMDLVNDARYGGTNPSAGLISALLAAGVTIELCGQTAAARGIDPADLLPGVRMSLSAMTAHALLQGQGYTLNPF